MLLKNLFIKKKRKSNKIDTREIRGIMKSALIKGKSHPM